MTRKEAIKLVLGGEATARQIRLNRLTNTIDVHEHVGMGESKVERSFPMQHNTVEGWREHNIAVLKAVHELTDGGRGRVVDVTVLRGWEHLGLVDRSTKVDLVGNVI